ncbi:MAG: hypothetical protein H2043_06615 [Rhizobiales bacterium]|nr:hypothetical protein [Hyphomicrobiales bacterium]
MSMSAPKPTDQEKALLQKAAEIEPLLSLGWQAFRNFEDGRTEILVEGDTGADARPILLLTEEISFADREFVARGPQMLRAALSAGRYLKDLVKQKEAEIRRLKGEPDPTENKFSHAKQCGMYCGRADFQQWLRDVHGADIADPNRIATHVRNMLRVKSRTELDENPEAAARWQSLLKSFKERAR